MRWGIQPKAVIAGTVLLWIVSTALAVGTGAALGFFRPSLPSHLLGIPTLQVLVYSLEMIAALSGGFVCGRLAEGREQRNAALMIVLSEAIAYLFPRAVIREPVLIGALYWAAVLISAMLGAWLATLRSRRGAE